MRLPIPYKGKGNPMPVSGLAELGPAGVLSLVVLGVCFGFLIPRWTFNKVVTQIEKEREEWRKLALQLLGVGQVAVTALEEIKKEAAKK